MRWQGWCLISLRRTASSEQRAVRERAVRAAPRPSPARGSAHVLASRSCAVMSLSIAWRLASSLVLSTFLKAASSDEKICSSRSSCSVRDMTLDSSPAQAPRRCCGGPGGLGQGALRRHRRTALQRGPCAATGLAIMLYGSFSVGSLQDRLGDAILGPEAGSKARGVAFDLDCCCSGFVACEANKLNKATWDVQGRRECSGVRRQQYSRIARRRRSSAQSLRDRYKATSRAATRIPPAPAQFP